MASRPVAKPIAAPKSKAVTTPDTINIAETITPETIKPIKTTKPKTTKSKESKTIKVQGPISRGAGMTAGLEIWMANSTYVLVDRTIDGRFESDVTSWSAAAGLNRKTTKCIKDATSA